MHKSDPIVFLKFIHNELMHETAWLQSHFKEIQLLLGLGFMLLFWLFVKPKEKSNFKTREFESAQKANTHQAAPTLLGDSKLNKKIPTRPLFLTGISLEGKPHEILGIKRSASEKEIYKAYRNLMKQYHPDKVARPGEQAWKDAQIIATRLTEAKNILLARIKNH